MTKDDNLKLRILLRDLCDAQDDVTRYIAKGKAYRPQMQRAQTKRTHLTDSILTFVESLTRGAQQ